MIGEQTISNSLNNQGVTVLLPFYNAENTLGRAIESILHQTFPNFELLLINNNSNDESATIASNYCEKDARCMLIHEETPGIVHALNLGLEVASGKYIARMDADDWSFPERLYRQYNFLEMNKSYGVVAGQAIYVPYNNKTEGFQRYVDWSNSILEFKKIYNRQFMESPIIHPTVMWRKEISEENGVYRQGDFPEDYELWLRWLEKGKRFHKLKEPVLKWFDNDNRLTRVDSRYSDLAFFMIKSLYLAKWLKKHNPFHPEVFIWGASKISRNRAKLLQNHGIQISGYIDITTKRQLDKKVIFYKDIASGQEIFILIYLREETMRAKTQQFLKHRGYVEGQNYLLVS